MKKIILVLKILMIVSISFAQQKLSGIYHINNFDEDTSCQLIFNDNFCYYLCFSEEDEDNILETELSFGSYKLQADKLILTDSIHGFEMKFLLTKNNTLKVKQCFIFLQSKTFTYYYNYKDFDCMKTTLNLSKKGLEWERKKYREEYKELIPLYFGNYNSADIAPDRWSYYKEGYELRISEKNQYQLYRKNKLYSSGSWSRKGNELTLFDIYLQHNFYLLISDKGLICRYIPGSTNNNYLFIFENK